MIGTSSISLDTEFGPLFSFRATPPSTSSPETLDLAYQWYEDCIYSHEKCKKVPLSTSRWIPTRLIDIGDENTTEWRLRITGEDLVSAPPPSYMTLSYRWSPEPRILLLSSNIDEFRRGVPCERLPQTFIDFIVVARRFHIRYIWIDSLCIVQDSQEDWELEAPKMRYVYGGSVCNVAASASSNPDSGMFRGRTKEDIQPGVIETGFSLSGSRRYYIFYRDYWERHLNYGALHDRGWVFQEIFLAPRVLHFSSGQVLWECLTEHKCEGFPRGIPLHNRLKNLDSLLLVEHTDEISSPQPMSWNSIGLWMDTVAKYSHCKFTRPEDKLWAFSGIAKLFQEAAGGQYLAGLWEPRLLEMMDWRVYNCKPRLSSAYRAPSWSWASVDGPVDLVKPHNKYDHLVEILEAKIESIKGASLGGISGAFLRLRGPLVTAKCQVQKGSILKIDIDPEPIYVFAYPDSMESQLVQNGQIFILLFKFQQEFPMPGGVFWDLVCFALEAVSGEERVFRRTGVFVLRDAEVWHKQTIKQIRTAATVHEITIV